MKFERLQIISVILIALSVMGCGVKRENRIPNIDNGILDNGVYDVRFNSYDDHPSIYEDYELTIEGFNYTKHFKDGRQESGTIEKIYEDKFVLTDYNSKQVPFDSLNDLAKQIRNWGPACFELKEQNGDTIKFRTTFSGQLHVETNRGVIVKKT